MSDKADLGYSCLENTVHQVFAPEDDLSSFVALFLPCWWGVLAVWRNVLFSQLYYINTRFNLVNKAQAITSVLITFSNIYPH